MKPYKCLIIVYFLTSTITSCKKEESGKVPTAWFKVETTTVEINKQVLFKDASSFEPTSWVWDFGDGNTSNEQNPKHSYNTIGNYTIKLTASNTYGSNSSTRTNFIEIIPGQKPKTGFTVNHFKLAINDKVILTDTTLNEIDNWHWDFGDGNSSEEQNPTHSYGESGQYIIKLTTSNIYGSSLKSKTIFIYQSVVDDIDGNRYGVEKFGEQEWFAEELKVTCFNNGTKIREVGDITIWNNMNSAALTTQSGEWIEAFPNNYKLYYNHYTVTEGNVCPSGYHVPSKAEWNGIDDIIDIEGTLPDKFDKMENHYWCSDAIDDDSAHYAYYYENKEYGIESINFQMTQKTDHVKILCIKD